MTASRSASRSTHSVRPVGASTSSTSARSAAQGRELALATIAGAAELAQRSSEPLAALRERVTSKGGTTHAALTALEAAGVKATFVRAIEAARRRAEELGDEFGR